MSAAAWTTNSASASDCTRTSAVRTRPRKSGICRVARSEDIAANSPPGAWSDGRQTRVKSVDVNHCVRVHRSLPSEDEERLCHDCFGDGEVGVAADTGPASVASGAISPPTSCKPAGRSGSGTVARRYPSVLCPPRVRAADAVDCVSGELQGVHGLGGCLHSAFSQGGDGDRARVIAFQQRQHPREVTISLASRPGWGPRSWGLARSSSAHG